MGEVRESVRDHIGNAAQLIGAVATAMRWDWMTNEEILHDIAAARQRLDCAETILRGEGM